MAPRIVSDKWSPRTTPRRGKLERPVYLEYRKSLLDMESDASKAFDRAMLTLPAGALALTLTFIKEIAKQPPRETILLFNAWGGLAISLLTILLAMVASQFSIRRFRSLLDRRQAGHLSPSEKGRAAKFIYWWWTTRNYAAALTIILNVISVLAFIYGVGNLSAFAIANLQ